MMKRLLDLYAAALTCNLCAYQYCYGLVKQSHLQYAMTTAVSAALVPKGLRQYYADLLMMELIESGRL